MKNSKFGTFADVMCAWKELSDFGMRWSCNSHISFGLLALLNMRFGIWFLFILWKSLRIELLGIFFVFIWWNFLWGYLIVSWKALHICRVKTLETCCHYCVPSFCLGWEHESLTTPLTTKLRRWSHRNSFQSIQGRRPTSIFVSFLWRPTSHTSSLFL